MAKARIGQRIKIISPTITESGVTFGDILAIHGDGYITVSGINPNSTVRDKFRLGPADWIATPGRTHFVHIDGERPNFGKNRSKSNGQKDEHGQKDEQAQPHKPEAQQKDGTDKLIDALKDAINEAVEQKVAQKMKEHKPEAQNVIVKVGKLPEVKLDGKPHKLLPRLLRLIAAGVSEKNIMLIGPAGSGKTYLAEQVSKVLGLPFAAVSFSPGMSEGKLLGRMVQKISDGSENYVSSAIVNAYVNGGVILKDELDNGDPSIVTVLNSFLANGWMYLPSGERVTRHPDTVVIGSMNTMGTGADRVYVGRNALDGATLDRFVVEMMDYDPELEKALCPEDNIREAVIALRKKVADNRIRRIVGTRMLKNVRSLVLGVGDTLDAAIRQVTNNWNDADRTLCGIKN